jgi:methylphosphotriester-DNA--protein-cysteine methyltransferase
MPPPEIHYFREDNKENSSLWKSILDNKQVNDVYYANMKKVSKLCRTSCTSRRKQNPKREDFVWFKTLYDGKRFGYKPCGRCRAADPDYQNPRERIKTAQQFGRQQMALNGRAPTLSKVASHLKISYEYCQRCFAKEGFSWSKFREELEAAKETGKMNKNIGDHRAQKEAVAGDSQLEIHPILKSMGQESVIEQNQNLSSSTGQLPVRSVSAVGSVSRTEQLYLPPLFTRDKLVDPRSLKNVVSSYENVPEDTSWQIPPPTTTAATTSSIYESALATVSCGVGESKVHDPTLLADEGFNNGLRQVNLLLNEPDFSIEKSDEEFEEEMDRWI